MNIQGIRAHEAMWVGVDWIGTEAMWTAVGDFALMLVDWENDFRSSAPKSEAVFGWSQLNEDPVCLGSGMVNTAAQARSHTGCPDWAELDEVRSELVDGTYRWEVGTPVFSHSTDDVELIFRHRDFSGASQRPLGVAGLEVCVREPVECEVEDGSAGEEDKYSVSLLPAWSANGGWPEAPGFPATRTRILDDFTQIADSADTLGDGFWTDNTDAAWVEFPWEFPYYCQWERGVYVTMDSMLSFYPNFQRQPNDFDVMPPGSLSWFWASNMHQDTSSRLMVQHDDEEWPDVMHIAVLDAIPHWR